MSKKPKKLTAWFPVDPRGNILPTWGTRKKSHSPSGLWVGPNVSKFIPLTPVRCTITPIKRKAKP